MKKIIILYDKFGMSHLRMANILGSMLKTEETEAQKLEACKFFAMPSMGIIVWLWNFLINKNLTRLADVLVVFGTRCLPSPFMEITSTKNVYAVLDKTKPDIIISAVMAYNKALGSYAKKNNIPFYIVMIDVIPAFMDMICPSAGHLCYFQESADIINSFDFTKTYFTQEINSQTGARKKARYLLGYFKDLFRGGLWPVYRNLEKDYPPLNNARCYVTGPMAEKKHFTPKNVESIRQRLQLCNTDTITMASGSLGGSLLKKIVKLINKSYDRPLNLLVVCGHDEKLKNWLKRFEAGQKKNNLHIHAFGYVDNFDELLAVSDCMIGRASAGVFVESLLAATPILTAKKVTANDRGGHKMIKKYSLGEIYENNSDLIAKLKKIITEKKVYKANMKKLTDSYPGNYEDRESLIKRVIINDNAS